MDKNLVTVFSESVTAKQIDDIVVFCRDAVSENKHAARDNMQYEDWEKKHSSLLYLLLIEKRFSSEKGGLQLLYNQEKIIAVSGYYCAPFDSKIYIIGVRAWVLKEFRFNLLIATWFLPRQARLAQDIGAHMVIITFNEQTKSFAKLIDRSNKNGDEFKFFFKDKYPEIYKDMIFWPKPLLIQNVKQWILIKNFKNYDFDWNALEYRDF